MKKNKNEIQKLLDEYELSIWYNFKDIYQHVEKVYKDIVKISEKPVLISIGRGGWIFSRILSAFFERDNIEHKTFTIIASYKNRDSPEEKPFFVQKLDDNSIMQIRNSLLSGGQIWVIDAPYVTGRVMKFVKNFLEEKFETKCKTAVLHLVKFKKIYNFPWRKLPTEEPDVYAVKIEPSQNNWYVQYPWEWTNLSAYDIVCGAFKNRLEKNELKNILKSYE